MFRKIGQWFDARANQHQTAIKHLEINNVLQLMLNKQVTKPNGANKRHVH